MSERKIGNMGEEAASHLVKFCKIVADRLSNHSTEVMGLRNSVNDLSNKVTDQEQRLKVCEDKVLALQGLQGGGNS